MSFSKLGAALVLPALALSGIAHAAPPAPTAARAFTTSLPVAKSFRAGARSGKKSNIFGAAPLLSLVLVAGAVAATVVVADQVSGGNDSN